MSIPILLTPPQRCLFPSESTTRTEYTYGGINHQTAV